jgi:DNA-binding transcriptional regulator YdaS (Cro superfamily)
MKTSDAEKYFGNRYRIAKAIGISPSAVYQWGNEVPKGSADQLELITGGVLRANPGPPPSQQAGCNGHDTQSAEADEGPAVKEGAG